MYLFMNATQCSEMIVQRTEGMAYEACAFICAKDCEWG